MTWLSIYLESSNIYLKSGTNTPYRSKKHKTPYTSNFISKHKIHNSNTKFTTETHMITHTNTNIHKSNKLTRIRAVRSCPDCSSLAKSFFIWFIWTPFLFFISFILAVANFNDVLLQLINQIQIQIQFN